MAEALIGAAGDGLVAVDRRGHVVVFNPAAGLIFGRDPASMVGQSIACLFVPGMFVEHQRYVDAYFAGKGRGVVGTTIETVGQRSDGSAVPIEISLSATRVGEEPLVLASIRDITRRRAADQRNRELAEQLMQSQKMEALGTLAAGIAHDFNNMLGAIMGYASAMARELSPTERHHADAQQILTVARRAKRLTDKLLTFSRGSDFKTEVFSVNHVARDVVGLLERTIPKNIVFKTKLAQQGTSVEGDRTQVEQVLLNLCLNSRDALPEGGEVLIETRRAQLDGSQAEVLRLSPGPYVQIAVRDNGLGMDAETLSRVFDPFFSTKPTGEGSGLGLSVVYSTVKSHGGHVRVTSEPGAGTEATVYLPATDAQPTPEEPRSGSPASPPGQGETILLVDDERHLRDMAKRLLEGLGYHVLLAETGDEAEAIFRTNHAAIDLVILDVVLVGTSGAETLDRLREIDSRVRVLVSSGHSREGEPRHLLSRGVSGFVQKPYGIEEVCQAIQRALATNDK